MPPRADQITITDASTDAEILATRDLMLELRPAVPPDTYVPTVRAMMAGDGFRVAALRVDGDVRAVVGYRVLQTLLFGRVLYVDDLNTDPASRSLGLGRQLMAWLRVRAVELDCRELQLDSGVQRLDTHRFYVREGLTIAAYHFRLVLDADAPSR
jgi:GNAT superfamily N-acetyltransferase